MSALAASALVQGRGTGAGVFMIDIERSLRTERLLELIEASAKGGQRGAPLERAEGERGPGGEQVSLAV